MTTATSLKQRPLELSGSRTMKAARIHEYGKPLVLEEVPRPVPGPGQVLVKVEGAGFCHSDLHVIGGEIPILPRMPVILGHENAGVVAELGDGVKGVQAGEKVAVFGGWGCEVCEFCVAGAEQLCAAPQWAGLSDRDGGYAEYILVPTAKYLVPLRHLDPAVAAPLTDAALTPYRAIKKALPFLTPDHHALVIGVGGLGQYGIKLLNILSGADVVAVDVSEEKLKAAASYGATTTLLAPGEELSREIIELTSGGVAAAFDFVGSEQTLALALSSTRTGGKVTQLGLAGGTARMRVMETNPWEVQFETTLWGSVKELREVIALAETGRLTPIDTEFMPLEQINEGHQRLRAGAVKGRLVITP